MIEFNCPNCNEKFEVDDELAGAIVECSACDFQFTVPGRGESDSPSCPESTPEQPPDDAAAGLMEHGTLVFSCPNCHDRLECSAELVGVRVACARCDYHFIVPPPNANDSAPDALPDEIPPPEAPADSSPDMETSPPPPLPAAEERAAPSGKLDLSAVFPECADPPTNSGEARSAPIDRTAQAPAVPMPTGRLSPRQRRLVSDFRMMRERFTSFPLIHLEHVQGNPPEMYVVSYRIRGIERLRGDQVVYRDYHEVEIKLPGTYPRTPPTCRMLTPVFHPNIEPAIICIGDHWTASERLCDLVVRIGEMIAYQSHNIKSPLDGEAAMWTDLHGDMLPIDSRDLTPPEDG